MDISPEFKKKFHNSLFLKLEILSKQQEEHK